MATNDQFFTFGLFDHESLDIKQIFFPSPVDHGNGLVFDPLFQDNHVVVKMQRHVWQDSFHHPVLSDNKQAVL